MPMRSARFAPVVVALAALVSACHAESTGEHQPPPLASSVVNPVMHAFLSKARAAHHRADIAEKDHDLKTAIVVLREVTEGSRPPLTPEVREVLADTHARIAELRAKDGDFDGAKREVSLGLDLATEPSSFRGHLFEVEGVIEQELMADLEKRGDSTGAAAAKERAKTAFDQAISTQEETIYRAIGTAGPIGSGAPP
jgi:hypothetical protein